MPTFCGRHDSFRCGVNHSTIPDSWTSHADHVTPDASCHLCPPAPEADARGWPEELRAETLARRFHELYERIAPQFGYKTKKRTRVPWSDVPDDNRELMLLVAAKIIEEIVEPREAGIIVKATAKGFAKGLRAAESALARANEGIAELKKAARLTKNTAYAKDKVFVGEWTCIPTEDFDRLRAISRGAKGDGK